MKALIISLLLVLVYSATAYSQDTTAAIHSTRPERMEYVLGATAAFSLFDYIGYNLVRKNAEASTIYRIVQGVTQAAISYILYKTVGLSSAISFNLIWWTWGDDIAYYGWTQLFNPAGPVWENRTNSGLRDPEVYWAGWTPIGLLRPQGSLIARDALLAQAMIGFSISMAILW